ncbi:hypothetical protein [Mangrovimonas xylaniphaga]|uniref:hypothetical protein n=1 Tax=Mangrovimonas xylaniphaga TaxID=1645915 RepID=UPI000AC28C8D|nr:hypothetical protein [Mangrovimonas xylaniphaga]
MSFGSMQGAITSINNNRKLLSKRDKLKNRLGGGNKSKKVYEFPEASPKMLNGIKEKILLERKQRDLKIKIVFTVGFVILCALFVYVMF